MDLLIIIEQLYCGGIQKSLITFLDLLEKKHPEINVELFLIKKEGIFVDFIPKSVKIIAPSKEIECMTNRPFSKNFLKNISAKNVFLKSRRYVRRFLRIDSKLRSDQSMWKNWRNAVPAVKKHYDMAISYMDGISNYFLIDKCNADRKYLFVHNEYSRLNYDSSFDYDYFSKAFRVLTVSENCLNDIISVFPAIKDKFAYFQNPNSTNTIKALADVGVPEEYASVSERKTIIVSIGRFAEQKRFDRAVDTAKILKDQKIDFIWFLLGDGELRSSLKKQIRSCGLKNEFVLLGEKGNPYPYIKYADIVVQTSDYEGKSIVIDEAKILSKPIVVTNYKTAVDTITDGVNGLIAEKNQKSVAGCIMKLLNNSELAENLRANLKPCADDYESANDTIYLLLGL